MMAEKFGFGDFFHSEKLPLGEIFETAPDAKNLLHANLLNGIINQQKVNPND